MCQGGIPHGPGGSKETWVPCAHQPGTGKVFPCPSRAGLDSQPGQVNTMVRVGGGGSQSQVAELHHTFTASDLNPPVGDPASEPALRACVARVHPHTHSQVSCVRAIFIASRACARVCVLWVGRVTTRDRWDVRGAGKGEVPRAGLCLCRARVQCRSADGERKGGAGRQPVQLVGQVLENKKLRET